MTFERLRILGRSRAGIAVACIFLLAALFSLLQLILLAVTGGGTMPLLVIHRPKLLLVATVGCGLLFDLLRRGPGRNRAQWGEFAARAALVAASTALALVLAEAGLRIFLRQVQSASSLENLDRARAKLLSVRIKSGHPLAAIIRRSADPRTIFELIPGLDMEFGHKKLRTNGASMRSDREYAAVKPPDTVRIVGIGDSGMFGWAVEQRENYIAVLEELLNRRGGGVRYEALNLGVPGYNTQMEVDSLEGRGLQYRPDIVVVGWSENDFQLPFMIPQEGLWTRRDISFLFLLLFDRRRFSDVALVRINDLSQADRSRVPAYFRENSGPEGVRRSLARLRALGEREGFPVLVFGAMESPAVAICREVGVPYYNTFEQIPPGTYPEAWAVHFIHPRAEGHRVLAERLAGEFERRGWIAPRPATQRP